MKHNNDTVRPKAARHMIMINLPEQVMSWHSEMLYRFKS